MSGRLGGRTALVTGASRGIGKAIALRLASEGARVGIHYGRSEAAAHSVAETVAAMGGSSFVVGAMLGDPKGVEALVAGLPAGERLELRDQNFHSSTTLGLFGQCSCVIH